MKKQGLNRCRDVGESMFLVELENLCKTWGISISHEDEHGGFILTNYSQEYMDWLKDAQSEFDRNKPEEKPEESTVTVDDILKA